MSHVLNPKGVANLLARAIRSQYTDPAKQLGELAELFWDLGMTLEMHEEEEGELPYPCSTQDSDWLDELGEILGEHATYAQEEARKAKDAELLKSAQIYC